MVWQFDHIATYYEYVASHFMAKGLYRDGECCEAQATKYLKMVGFGA